MGRMSARMIGRELGCMTAQEVNMLLCEEGFLEGEPGDYIGAWTTIRGFGSSA